MTEEGPQLDKAVRGVDRGDIKYIFYWRAVHIPVCGQAGVSRLGYPVVSHPCSYQPGPETEYCCSWAISSVYSFIQGGILFIARDVRQGSASTALPFFIYMQ